MKTTEIDVAKLKAGMQRILYQAWGVVRSIYVADMRTQTAGTESGVRDQRPAVNGFNRGNAEPLYVKGHFNARRLLGHHQYHYHNASLVEIPSMCFRSAG